MSGTIVKATPSIAPKLASLISEAVAIYEGSFDYEKAEQAVANETIAKEEGRDYPIVDANSFYQMTLGQACQAACDTGNEPAMAQMLYYLVRHSWNESLEWAKENKPDMSWLDVPAEQPQADLKKPTSDMVSISLMRNNLDRYMERLVNDNFVLIGTRHGANVIAMSLTLPRGKSKVSHLTCTKSAFATKEFSRVVVDAALGDVFAFKRQSDNREVYFYRP